jgi:hypothetical protein
VLRSEEQLVIAAERKDDVSGSRRPCIAQIRNLLSNPSYREHQLFP